MDFYEIHNMRWSLGVLLFLGLGYTVNGDEAKTSPNDFSCQPGWQRLHRGCYQFHEEGLTWEAAKTECSNGAVRGQLVSIQSLKEKAELMTYLSSTHARVKKWWAGIPKRKSHRDAWKWTQGEPVDDSVTQWEKPKSKKRRGNYCGGITSDTADMKIIVDRCTRSKPFICEYHDITPRPTVDITTTDGGIVDAVRGTDGAKDVFKESKPTRNIPSTRPVENEKEERIVGLADSSTDVSSLKFPTGNGRQGTITTQSTSASPKTSTSKLIERAEVSQKEVTPKFKESSRATPSSPSTESTSTTATTTTTTATTTAATATTTTITTSEASRNTRDDSYSSHGKGMELPHSASVEDQATTASVRRGSVGRFSSSSGRSSKKMTTSRQETTQALGLIGGISSSMETMRSFTDMKSTPPKVAASSSTTHAISSSSEVPVPMTPSQVFSEDRDYAGITTTDLTNPGNNNDNNNNNDDDSSTSSNNNNNNTDDITDVREVETSTLDKKTTGGEVVSPQTDQPDTLDKWTDPTFPTTPTAVPETEDEEPAVGRVKERKEEGDGQSIVEEDDEEEEVEVDVTESSTKRSSATTRGSTRTDPSTTSTSRKTKPTRTTTIVWTRPTPPRPTTVNWHEEFEDWEECYIPGVGSSLKDTVLKARRLYDSDASVCPEVKVGNIVWPETEFGQLSRVKCRRGDGFATFRCGEEPTCWHGQPDITGCASKKLQNLLKKVSKKKTESITDMGVQVGPVVAPPTVEESIELTSQLVEVTETEVSMEDVMVTSQLITALTTDSDGDKKPGEKKNKEQVEQIVDNVVQAGSNLVSSNKSALWEEMTTEDKVRSASSLLVAMETATVAMADEIEEETVIKQKDENIELELRVVDVETLEQEDKQELVYGSEQSENTFSIPVETLKSVSKGKLAKAVFMTHYSMADIMGGRKRGHKKAKGKKMPSGSPHDDPEVVRVGSVKERKTEMDTDQVYEEESNEEVEEEEEEEEGPKIASYILSASLGVDGHIMKLPKPISFTMKHIQLVDEKEYIPLCSFWNVSDGDRMGFWSQDGCRVLRSNKSSTTCECDHLTNFAILLDVHGVKITSVHQTALRLVTIIGCVISIIALAASWVTFQCFASLQGERNSIHKNLAVCLLVAELLFVCGIDKYDEPALCSVVAGFLHYFFLATFTWMFLEGLHIIFMLVQVFDSSRSRLPYYYMAGYGMPLVIVGVSCLYYYRGYGTDSFCWLSTDRYFIWAFAGPVALILLVNAIFLVYAMTTVCRHSDYVFNAKDKSTSSGIRAWVQGALAMEVLLGLTWMFGYFLINDNSIAVAYVFTILNSLQGLFIFFFHCILNKKAQKEYRRVMKITVKRTPSTTQSTLTKRTGHTSDHQELNQSTSANSNSNSNGHANGVNGVNGVNGNHSMA